MAKKTKGELIVASELPHELLRVVPTLNPKWVIIMEDRNFVGWKSSDSECPNFSQYLVQMQILLTFLEWPAGKQRPNSDLVNEFSVSQICGWDLSWNQGQKVCLKSYITLSE